MNKPIKIIDLFAGPGGLGEGFASVGSDNNPVFKIAVSVEKEASAHRTLTLRAFTREFKNRVLPKEYYEYIRGKMSKEDLIKAYPAQWAAACEETLGGPVALGEDNELIHRKIAEVLEKNKEPWVLIGGPPCQAYSLAGRARNMGSKDYVAEEDGRHFLYKEYLEIIKKYKPAVFVMENVKGILSSSPTGKPIFDQILSDLKNPDERELKYNLYSLSNAPRSTDMFGPVFNARDFIIRAEDYGVPQARHRVILLGVRSDIAVEHSQTLLDKSLEVNVGQVLANMPKLRSGLSKNKDDSASWQQIAQLALQNAASLVNVDKDKILKIPLPKSRGKNFVTKKNTLSKELPKQLKDWLADEKLGGIIQHETRGHMSSDIARYAYVSLFGKRYGRSPLISEFPKHLLPNHKNVNSGKFVDRFKSQVSGSPSKTITSHIAKDSHAFIHFDPLQSRGFTVREAARIQTFPENYFFEGNRTQQYVQVGNAVPPYLAMLIAAKISTILKL
jgi:DNA (cytosine-5)-methyltransferase 1